VLRSRRSCPSWSSNAYTPARLNELGELFILHKNRREARAIIMTHQLGWGMRLMVGAQLEVVQTKVCRSEEEVFDCGDRWKAALMEKGWS